MNVFEIDEELEKITSRIDVSGELSKEDSQRYDDLLSMRDHRIALSTEIVGRAKELKSIDESKAEQIKAVFAPMVEMVAAFESDYAEIIERSKSGISHKIIIEAKDLRKAISRIRIDAEKTRKQEKEKYLRAGKAIDGVANILKWAVEEKEEHLKTIENHWQIQEEKRLAELQEKRAALLSEYVEDAHERDLAKFEDDEFIALLSMKKKEKEEAIEAHRIAEEKRKADAEELERLRKEREEAEAKAAKAKAEAEAELRKEREAREAIERDLAAKAAKEREEAEAKAAKAKAEAEAELAKGDHEKVLDLINDLNDIKEKYSFSSMQNELMFEDVKILITKIVTHIKKVGAK